MKITIKNKFHNTEVSLYVPDDFKVSKYQKSRAERALCGMDDCYCSNHQTWIFDHWPDGDGRYAIFR